jgi:hypothetical protein
MANSSMAQIRMRIGRGMLLLVFFFAMNPPPAVYFTTHSYS